eukprot:CAMPEP_0197314916 /NCGR_PEP_ID=MMETSP0891-20130614/35806_1 /TAXON_ID=44058 ORGANISM="Aureoumbra lagunensis, Strain CCMP1510" /NCGR_SAMPLE_ID=MMETSP0891 /ASSEMBLY_ACC=CAM_ASM_000534 /LENGTH=402 /DNA_ID=CAMNT_0042803593 /DNA_START=110 /DNA_END=1318 /DNA_ORIENTATION=+
MTTKLPSSEAIKSRRRLVYDLRRRNVNDQVNIYLNDILERKDDLKMFEMSSSQTLVKPNEWPWHEQEIEKDNSLLWKGALLGICFAWATNFALLKFGVAQLPSSHVATGPLFVAARFTVASLACAPFLFNTNPQVLKVGTRIGAWCAFGYAAQAIALNHFHISASETAFECSLQTVVVAAWLAAQSGHLPPRTIASVTTAVTGVAILCFCGGTQPESNALIPTHYESIVGALIALGQAIGFGASYIELEKASEDFPQDAQALAAIQCMVVAIFALAAAKSAGADFDAIKVFTTDLLNSPSAMASVLWMGLISTSFTIWLQAKAFSRVNSQDASLILTSEPVWAALCARALLSESLNLYQILGGVAVLAATAIHDGLIPVPFLSDKPFILPGAKDATDKQNQD